MNVRYRITLTSEEREQLRALVKAGKGRFRRLKRAQILLAASGGSSDVAIAKNVVVGASTVYRTKRRFVEEGLEAALSEEPRPGVAASLRRRRRRCSWRRRARRRLPDERAGRLRYWLARWCG